MNFWAGEPRTHRVFACKFFLGAYLTVQSDDPAQNQLPGQSARFEQEMRFVRLLLFAHYWRRPGNE